MSKKLKVISTGILSTADINKLREFPNDTGVQRFIDEANVKRIMNSMQELYIPSVIKINQDWYILDGQHSKEAIKRLHLNNEELVYVQYDTSGLDKDVCVLLNTTSKKWTSLDFLNVWVSTGKDDYIFLKAFLDKYQFPFQLSLYMFGVTVQGGNNAKFKNGTMIISPQDREKGIEAAHRYIDLKEYIPNEIIRMQSFGKAFAVISRNSKYNHNRMIKQVTSYRDKIYKCSSIDNYKKMLEDVYNFKRRDKVNF